MKNLKWYALVRDMNTDEVKPYNIFDNWWVYNEVEVLLENGVSTKLFIERLDLVLQYAFRSRFEYEIFIGNPFDETVNGKINVYDQVKNNIPQLVDYIIENAKE